MNRSYEQLFTTVRSNRLSPRTTVNLRQYPDGPTLNVECYAFVATHPNQTRVLHQSSSGWHPADTTAYCLADSKIEISSYVQGCVESALREACAPQFPFSLFFRLTQFYKDVSILLVHRLIANWLRLLSSNNV